MRRSAAVARQQGEPPASRGVRLLTFSATSHPMDFAKWRQRDVPKTAPRRSS